MALELSYSIEGVTQLSRTLDIIASRVSDWTPAFQETALSLKDIFSRDVFDSEGGAIGEHWQPLSQRYVAQKERKFPGKPILEATGTMRNSFMTLWRLDMAQVWNSAEYFRYHQSNQSRSSNLPRRVMMKLAEQQKQLVVRIFNTHFQSVVGAKASFEP